MNFNRVNNKKELIRTLYFSHEKYICDQILNDNDRYWYKRTLQHIFYDIVCNYESINDIYESIWKEYSFIQTSSQREPLFKLQNKHQLYAYEHFLDIINSINTRFL